MKPPYELTEQILSLITLISEKLGMVNAHYLNRQSPQLRKRNKVKTIHASVQIEGNTLTEEQITSLIDKKRIIGPEKDIREVINAIEVYEDLYRFHAFREKDFLKAHEILLAGLPGDAGKYRKKSVGIVQGKQVTHLAPPHAHVPGLMKELFAYLSKGKDPVLIRSCVFHYELEFIHPFMDGNGRMGRLWQTIALLTKYPVFEYLPFETLISKDQDAYYRALAKSDNAGSSTIFIEYMLGIIDTALEDLLHTRPENMSSEERIAYYAEFGKKEFSRKEYMDLFKTISSATASRDLKLGVEKGLFGKSGERNQTRYLNMGD